MTSKITKILNRNFKNIVQSIKILEPQHNKLFNKLVKNKVGENKNSFVAELLCGETCYISKYLLEREGYQVKVWKNSMGYGRYYKYHCFMIIDDSIIVDPTYRQFAQDSRISNVDCEYSNYIHFNLPPFFIGTTSELTSQLNQIQRLNKSIYGSTELYDIHNFWRFQQDISNKFDLSLCINDPDYLQAKYYFYRKNVKNIEKIFN